jgi:geranylgeranyl pyrophosphate synthase
MPPLEVKRSCGEAVSRIQPRQRYGALLEECRDRLRRIGAHERWHPELVELAAGGKLLRPYLLLAAADAVGGDAARSLQAAEAVELLHAASLVHDDIVDGSPLRRGRPALHVTVGREVALVAGDLLLTTAVARLATPEDGADSGRRLRAVAIFAACAARCCLGEIADLGLDRRTLGAEYVAVAREKTAAQFVGAATIGAVLSGSTDAERHALATYAEALGVAFQLDDDLRDRDVRARSAWALRSLYVERALTALQSLRRSPGRAALHDLADSLRGADGHDR